MEDEIQAYGAKKGADNKQENFFLNFREICCFNIQPSGYRKLKFNNLFSDSLSQVFLLAA